MIHVRGSEEKMSPKRNYNKMYDSKTEDTVVDNQEAVEFKEDPKPEKKKFPIEGKVIGGSLNVRIKPDGNVKSVLSNDEKVKIIEEKEDWYKIAGPTDGYVMKKFIEV